MRKILFIILPVLAFIFASCSEEFDSSVFDYAKVKGESNSTATYIEIFPQWDNLNLNNPQAIIFGNEPLLYVCDTGNDRVLMMNSAGTILGSLSIKHPIAITQDYRLNLYVCGLDTFLTTSGGSSVVNTVSAVFKIDLYAAQHHMENAVPVRILPDRNISISLDPKLEYTGLCAFYDNSIYISRQGPNNTKAEPDNSVLIYKKNEDTSKHNWVIERVPGLEALGTGFRSINKVTSLTSFKRQNKDFVVTLIADNASFKAQWLYFNDKTENQKFESRLTVSTEMMTPNRFGSPTGSCIDNKRNIFIADAAKDSIYKFNEFGEEMESFGGTAYGFKSPMGVAFNDKTIYVTDSKNNKIRRFRLSSELK